MGNCYGSDIISVRKQTISGLQLTLLHVRSVSVLMMRTDTGAEQTEEDEGVFHETSK
jgi:hypothetical protein